ncbi:MAG: 16S rRNA (guanine(966)-N(2))-methyltransferase RsmD [Rhabdochlamydiaceae bacterium]|jgi:16S rRNA (guanine966-N2)-methyltransferase
MTFRIIGGSFRNRPLKSPKGDQTRPTLAVMRKAVFDILQSKVEGAAFLDLYAGTGAMGLEALSRGASHATFVETDRPALGCIEENCRTLKVESQSTLMGYDSLLALKKLVKQSRRFDIVYADPPYTAASRLHLLQEILTFFDTHPLLNRGGTLFLEEAAPPSLNTKGLSLIHLRHVDTRSFSRSALHQFQSI